MNKKSGFTIPEVLIAIFITVVIITIIILIQNTVLDQQQLVTNSYISMNTANNSVQQMVKEIRNCQFAENGAYLLEVLNDQEISFFSNVDDDDEIEKVHYRLEGSDLVKSVIDPTDYPVDYPPENAKTKVVAENVVNGQEPIFYYYNSDYPLDELNNPLVLSQRATQTRLIGINLIININQNILAKNYQIESYAHIRTLKDNL
jgi:type II secretory pathway pseudopilin PulG